MILEGNQRGFGAELARHLLNPRDNDHVTIHAVEGFVAEDLAGAFAECEAIAQGTQCSKYLFSLSLNPPPGVSVPVEDFEAAVVRIEAKLGLSGQPRAIVFHEKNGRRHAHCVWSRIDAARMRAINLPHSKRKLMDISIELYRTHGWPMPAGFRDYALRNPQNYSRAEAGHAKRTAQDPQALKTLFRNCWECSDSRAGFAAALWAQGYCLARGDQRGFVAVDGAGKVWSLSRWCSVKAKELRTRLGDPSELPSIDEAAHLLAGMSGPDGSRTAIDPDPGLGARRTHLIDTQRQERSALLTAQEQRRTAENNARQARLPRGLRAAWARLSGQYARLVAELARQAAACETRDRKERQALIDQHLSARRALERSAPEHDLSGTLEAVFADAVRSDARQRLVMPSEALLFTPRELANKPSLILAQLSHKKARFSEINIKRALADIIDDPLVLRAAIDTALAAPELVRLGESGDFTTKDYRDAEYRLDEDVPAMAGRGGFAVGAHHIEGSMCDQDMRMEHRFGGALSDEQRVALRHILGDCRFAQVVGLAGAGKSTMLETARDAWARQGTKVHGAALSGKAAEGLQRASGIDSRTLASLEASWRSGYEPIARGDVLVIDEAGMIGTRQLMRIASKIRQVGAKLVLIGDPDQLQPIEAGRPFRHLVESHGAARLTEIHRQRDTWQRIASRDLAEGRVEAAVQAYEAQDAVRRCNQRDKTLSALVEDYIKDHEACGPEVTRLAFAHRRKDVFALNQSIRRAIRLSGDAPAEIVLNTATGPRAFAKGERIVLTRNDREIGVKNGMLGMIEAVSADEISVLLDSEDGNARRVTFDPGRYNSFDHGYAVTIHKSQGATVERAFVLASRTMDRPLTYVAMTRHREALRLYINERDRPGWATRQVHGLRRPFGMPERGPPR